MTKGNHFEKYDDHTLVKHFLLEAYLKRWATILLGDAHRRGMFPRVWFVDAFAGAGGDETGRPGSPVIAATIARDINSAAFPQGVTTETGMRVLGFETEPEYFRLLQDRMKVFTESRPWIAALRNYSLDTKIDEVVGHLKDDPALYFLDPFGVDGLSATVVEKILAGPHNEILALFTDEGAVRLAGKASIGEVDADDIYARAESDAAASMSLFGPGDDEKRLAEARRTAARVVAGHKSNPNAERILDVAYGGNWWRAVHDASPVDQRREMMTVLYERLLRERDASYVLRFSIETKDGRRKYYLVHASKNRSAHIAMKEAMDRTRKANYAIDDTGLDTFVSTTNVAEIVDGVAKHFAGQTIRWVDDQRLRGKTVQAYAIGETKLWLHERDAFVAIAKNRGWAVPNPHSGKMTPLTFQFPAIAEKTT